MNDTGPIRPWAPFRRELFDDPDAQALGRVGVVDVGSNSVRLVVFDGAARSPAYFFNEKIMCGLGRGLGDTGLLDPEGRARALAALERFNLLADSMGISPLTVVATAAVREASDGPDFVADVKRRTGLDVFVIDGAEEARLSAQGILLGWPGSYGVVCDIGGSSMEMAQVSDGRIRDRATSKLGPLKLQNVKGGRKAVQKYITENVKSVHKAIGKPTKSRLFLVGGSWRAIARIDMDRRDYPLTVLHEFRMDPDGVPDLVDHIAGADPEELRARCKISEARMALVPLASEVLLEVVRRLKPKDITISSYGIREGLLYEQMPDALRARDPLLEACRFAEAKDARLPGFGARLYDFVRPLFPDADWQRDRLIRAACLLHDVSWRAHPDFRPEVCFDNATRANLGGLKHNERIALGLALLHRYTKKREGTSFERLLTLVDDDEIRFAETLGYAMRLGAMLWIVGDEVAGDLDYRDGTLTLSLRPDTARLWGETVEARLKALAQLLDVTAEMRVD